MMDKRLKVELAAAAVVVTALGTSGNVMADETPTVSTTGNVISSATVSPEESLVANRDKAKAEVLALTTDAKESAVEVENKEADLAKANEGVARAEEVVRATEALGTITTPSAELEAARLAVSEAETARSTAENEVNAAEKEMADLATAGSETDDTTRLAAENLVSEKEAAEKAAKDALTEAEAGVAAAEEAENTAKVNVETLSAEVAAADKALSDSEAGTTAVESSFIPVSKKFAEELKRAYEATNHGVSQPDVLLNTTLIELGHELAKQARFVSNSADIERYVSDLNTIDPAIRKELSLFAASLYNQIRKQMDIAIPVKVSEASIEIADKVANRYDADNHSSFTLGHDIPALNAVSEEVGMTISENLGVYTSNEGASEAGYRYYLDKGYTGRIPSQPNRYSVDLLKYFIFNTVIDFVLRDEKSNYSHAYSVSGLRQPDPNLTENYLGVSTHFDPRVVYASGNQTFGSFGFNFIHGGNTNRFEAAKKVALTNPYETKVAAVNPAAVVAAKNRSQVAHQKLDVANASLISARQDLAKAQSNRQQLANAYQVAHQAFMEAKAQLSALNATSGTSAFEVSQSKLQAARKKLQEAELDLKNKKLAYEALLQETTLTDEEKAERLKEAKAAVLLAKQEWSVAKLALEAAQFAHHSNEVALKKAEDQLLKAETALLAFRMTNDKTPEKTTNSHQPVGKTESRQTRTASAKSDKKVTSLSELVSASLPQSGSKESSMLLFTGIFVGMLSLFGLAIQSKKEEK